MNPTSTSRRSNRATTQQPTTTHTEAIPAGPHPAATPDTRRHAATHRDRDLDPRPPAGGPTSSATPRPRARRRIFPLPPGVRAGPVPSSVRLTHGVAPTSPPPRGIPVNSPGPRLLLLPPFVFLSRFVCAARLLLLLSSLLPPSAAAKLPERKGRREEVEKPKAKANHASLFGIRLSMARVLPLSIEAGEMAMPRYSSFPELSLQSVCLLVHRVQIVGVIFFLRKKGKFGGVLAIFLVGEKRSLGLVGADDASKVVCLGGFLLICSFTNSK